jgi:hypothetical protein
MIIKPSDAILMSSGPWKMQDPRCSLDRIPKGDASSSYLRTLSIILRHVSNQLVVQQETVVTQI